MIDELADADGLALGELVRKGQVTIGLNAIECLQSVKNPDTTTLP